MASAKGPGLCGPCRFSRLAVSAAALGVGILGAVAAAERVPLAVVAAWARRQVLGRADLQLVAAVGALVGAGRDVAAGWDWFRHVACSLTVCRLCLCAAWRARSWPSRSVWRARAVRARLAFRWFVGSWVRCGARAGVRARRAVGRRRARGCVRVQR